MAMAIKTKFVLQKGRITTYTYYPWVVRVLRVLGWKVKVSELGELI